MTYIYITLIVCFVVDISGFVDSVKYGLFRAIYGTRATYRDYRLKPFDCSLCMTFWTCMGYAVFSGNLSVKTVLLACLLAFLSENITHLMILVKDCIGFLTNKAEDRIND